MDALTGAGVRPAIRVHLEGVMQHRCRRINTLDITPPPFHPNENLRFSSGDLICCRPDEMCVGW